jgi:AbiJ N-terminal domain 4
MKSFSEKYGFKPTRTVLQSDSMDDPLRNGLWNAIYSYYYAQYGRDISPDKIIKLRSAFIRDIWTEFFNLPIDEFSEGINDIKKQYVKLLWYEVYDLLQFCLTTNDNDLIKSKFKMECNRVLERDKAIYRFVGDEIAQITSKTEITEIEKAVLTDDPMAMHLTTALKLFSDKESPDYRNSIKESISAVEALCRIITDKPKATLGEALDKIKKSELIDLHPALNSAFDKLYGYTSDKDGIRHALLDGKNELKQEDAIFMLVACSAFVNYLKAKIARVQETKK